MSDDRRDLSSVQRDAATLAKDLAREAARAAPTGMNQLSRGPVTKQGLSAETKRIRALVKPTVMWYRPGAWLFGCPACMTPWSPAIKVSAGMRRRCRICRTRIRGTCFAFPNGVKRGGVWVR